jgi:chromosome segregation ATPase
MGFVVHLRQIGEQLETQLSTVTADFEKARSTVDEQSQEISQLEAQLQKFIAENQYLKSRYDKDIAVKSEEFDELR